MARIGVQVLRRYLFGGQISTHKCLQQNTKRSTALSRSSARSFYAWKTPRPYSRTTRRNLETKSTLDASRSEVGHTPNVVPFRKQLKDEAKKRKTEAGGRVSKADNQALEGWELTVGIEIHAQLNTARKLFSAAASTINDVPNTHVAPFDVAIPGSLPVFQKETIVPALRAALALNCKIQNTSQFDRKHYFHWDQPSGYQITQYYKPFAKEGYIRLYAHDGIAKEDGDYIDIGIKQVQMEQDTAKTISEPGDIHLLDFNRVGLPLIEIITLPEIHHPSTAAALVRKVQIILNAVDACVLGMQSGGLRADVNVSVRRRDATGGEHEYAGVKGLGQRTEIKNLSSFKAVEDAIIAERDRQIQVLESGGVIEGETRGWTIGSTETRRLRGKEGEVDYRYMPDPDLAPVVIGDDLVDYLKNTLGLLPDQEIDVLRDEFGLTLKDAMSLISLNDGGRYEYFRKVVDEFLSLNGSGDAKRAGRLCGNWVLHEMGGLTSDQADEENPLRMTPEGSCLIQPIDLAHLIWYLDTNRITGKSAKRVLEQLEKTSPINNKPLVERFIDTANLWFSPLSEREYEKLARSILDLKVVEQILAGKEGKINFLVGQMMRKDSEGRVDAQKAAVVLRKIIEEYRK
ncbi:glutamyl-tRNA amidotransferase-like protein subunit B [Tricladium varicosporioides]|nr:glutamyl-tRNA amidotransferase-like protein subunit B [Hymenoscyphus varicosporioides]